MYATLRMPWVAGKLVGTTRLEMLARGFTLVDTPRCFRDGRLLKMKKSMMLKLSDCNRQLPELARYGCWLQRLIQDALPEERVSLAILEFRYEAASHADKQVDRLHADGSYIRSVYTLYGPSTIYRDGKVEWPVPDDQTLLMTAIERARARHVPCTLHRRPGRGFERAIIVCSFQSHRLTASPPAWRGAARHVIGSRPSVALRPRARFAPDLRREHAGA